MFVERWRFTENGPVLEWSGFIPLESAGVIEEHLWTDTWDYIDTLPMIEENGGNDNVN